MGDLWQIIKDVFGPWYMWGSVLLLIVLIGVFFYLRSQKEED